MAPKRHTPLADPPSASSSSEEEEIEEMNDTEVVQDQNPNKENAESEVEEEEEEDDESGDEEEEEEEEEEKNKKPTVVQNPSEDSDSETHSGESLPSPTASAFTVKPILSKPMDDPTSKPKKPTSKPAPKRPAESGKEPQNKKSRVSNGGDEVEEKKSAINRLWSEDDEIVILKGMIEYQTKKGADPTADAGAFLEFIKKSLHKDVSKNQLMDKIRRLKKKYQVNAEKGEDPVFSKPHEHKSFDLSKKVWGGGGSTSNAVDENAKSNNRKARKSVKVSNLVSPPKENGQQEKVALAADGLKAEVVKDVKVEKGDFWSMYPRLQESLELEKSSDLAMSEPEKNFVKEKMSLIGSVKAKELEEKWKNFRVEEVALYLKRVELLQEQTKLMLDAMKSSKY